MRGGDIAAGLGIQIGNRGKLDIVHARIFGGVVAAERADADNGGLENAKSVLNAQRESLLATGPIRHGAGGRGNS